MKHLTIYEPVEFSDECTTERGEKVYKTLKIEVLPCGSFPIMRVLTCDKGIGITEEWIFDTIKGCQEALYKDFPNDSFNIVTVKPNHIRFEYAGPRGVVM